MTLPSHPSVLIVGAGPIGLCAGIELLQAGHQVVIVDSGMRGAGWASGGMLAPIFEMVSDPSCPEALVQLALTSAEMWPFLAQRCEIELKGPSLFLARTPEEAESLFALQSRAAGLDLEVASVGLPPGLKAQAAFEAASERALEPRSALQNLMTEYKALGGDLVIGHVKTIAPSCLSLMDGRTLEADAIVLANGFGTAAFIEAIPELQALSAVKGQMLSVAHPELASPIVRAGRVYLLSRGGGLVIGASSDPLAAPNDSVNADPILALLAEARTLLPSLKSASPVEAWAGLRPRTPDHVPLVGASGIPSIFLATGTYRNGWLLAPVIGAYLRQLLSGQEMSAGLRNLFAPTRFNG